MNFGKSSKSKLLLLDNKLQNVARLALEWEIIDFTVYETFRDKITQDRYFNLGSSKVMWPNGKHNKIPSEAMDLVPFVDGKESWDWKHCLVLAGVILAASKVLGISIRWGGNWDMDGEPVTDQDFQDLVHYEFHN